MLKTNSKKARENVRAYIINHFTPESYTDAPPTEWNEIARYILETFKSEKRYSLEYMRGISQQSIFEEWCAGLPSLLDTCYYYNRSAVEDLGNILEESESEKARFTESEAERVLTNLIYSELIRGARILKEPKTIY